jgi:hypothetical protein
MRRLAFSLAALVLAMPALAAPDDGGQHLRAQAFACFQARAAAVERVQPSLADATDFLVLDLCAQPDRLYDRYITNTKLVAQMRSGDNPWSEALQSMGATLPQVSRDRLQQQSQDVRATWAKVTVDPDTGELVMPTDLGADYVGPTSGLTASDISYGAQEVLRPAAAEALLAARTARLGK